MNGYNENKLGLIGSEYKLVYRLHRGSISEVMDLLDVSDQKVYGRFRKCDELSTWRTIRIEPKGKFILRRHAARCHEKESGNQKYVWSIKQVVKEKHWKSSAEEEKRGAEVSGEREENSPVHPTVKILKEFEYVKSSIEKFYGVKSPKMENMQKDLEEMFSIFKRIEDFEMEKKKYLTMLNEEGFFE